VPDSEYCRQPKLACGRNSSLRVPDLTEDQNELLRQVVADFVARTEAETGHAPSQRDLSRILGITQQTICNFLRGDNGAGYATATRIAQQLAGAASVEDLLRSKGASSAPQPPNALEAEVARLHGAELAVAAARLMAKAQGFDALFRRVWVPDDPAETDADLLWAECKTQYARWSKAKTRRPATHTQQLERYAALVERIAIELATQVRAGVIDSAEVLEDTIRRMPVELPIDPTLLSERSAHAREAAKDVRDGNVHRLARRSLVLDVLAATREGLGKEFRTFFANRATRRDVAS
jgi:hypothetical protein